MQSLWWVWFLGIETLILQPRKISSEGSRTIPRKFAPSKFPALQYYIPHSSQPAIIYQPLTHRSRSSPPQRSRTPPRSRSQERVERDKKRHHDREKEREDTARDEEDYEERMRQRKLRSRDKAYREVS